MRCKGHGLRVSALSLNSVSSARSGEILLHWTSESRRNCVSLWMGFRECPSKAHVTVLVFPRGFNTYSNGLSSPHPVNNSQCKLRISWLVQSPQHPGYHNLDGYSQEEPTDGVTGQLKSSTGGSPKCVCFKLNQALGGSVLHLYPLAPPQPSVTMVNLWCN